MTRPRSTARVLARPLPPLAADGRWLMLAAATVAAATALLTR